ncbi:hypothetical protein JOB18_018827 [Solea senegalensis]|uniref:Uncharacterized protein n=1 Tax=Solea senegalensis TaxID=28829 RepID=A0AAV6Q5N1_SOLSE|nr:hypothetical protein JOB18_018827 [Solea senegalensis]
MSTGTTVRSLTQHVQTVPFIYVRDAPETWQVPPEEWSCFTSLLYPESCPNLRPSKGSNTEAGKG